MSKAAQNINDIDRETVHLML